MAGAEQEEHRAQFAEEKPRKLTSMEEYYIQELLPLALSFGMTANEFWHEDPALMWSYYLAYKQKAEAEASRIDMEAWLYGSYVHEAVAIVMIECNPFGGRRRGKRLAYPTQPRSLQHEKQSNLSEADQLKMQQREQIAKMKAFHNSLINVPKFSTP